VRREIELEIEPEYERLCSIKKISGGTFFEDSEDRGLVKLLLNIFSRGNRLLATLITSCDLYNMILGRTNY
jgi:hypothetical protein